MANENLGPAERIIQTLLAYTDHCVHNRPGFVTPDPRAVTGVNWQPATTKKEGDAVQVFTLQKIGKKQTRTLVGTLAAEGRVVSGGREVGTYRNAGLFPEVAAWMYRQVAEVWKLDNEFAARWASYAFGQEHKDLKVVLAAFMLCQSRRGDPQLDEGKLAFYDADYRDVGEAMILLMRKDGKGLDPKLVLRVHDVLELAPVAAINRELGFGRSAREPFFGRWHKAVTKWLLYREENLRLLEGLVKGGQRQMVRRLAILVGYKPQSPKFFEVLRWKQEQADDGRRALAIGVDVAAAESWAGLTEAQICERIVREKLNYKRITSLLPKEVGVTRAVMAAAIESGALSDKDLILMTPTLEELGLLTVQDVKARWEGALKRADDMRAANIARNVRTAEVKEKLLEGADTALKKAAEEVTRGLRVYVIVDVSGSMEGAIEAAKGHLARFVQGIPMDRLHVSVFNTAGREIKIPHASAKGVENAFVGVHAGGGTDYGAGIRALQHYRPKADEDALFIFVGDEGNNTPFHRDVEASGLKPVAFGIVPVSSLRYGRATKVRDTAVHLGLPCFEIDERTFADPYAIPRALRALVAATPVAVRQYQAVAVAAPMRVTLVDQILKTDLLAKPAWAA